MSVLLANAPADPAILFAEEIDDLLLEAKNHLDGEPIATEGQAEAVSSLLNRLRRVSKDADTARADEKRPHDEAAKAVQGKWKPLLDKAGLAVNVAKEALAPWLVKVEEKQRAEAEAARIEADRLAQVAAGAFAKSSGNLQARDDAERLVEAAREAEKHAAKADKAKAHARGGERAVGLRSVWTPTLTDPCAALRFYRDREGDALKSWLVEQAEKDVRAGARSIPGFEVTEARVAV